MIDIFNTQNKLKSTFKTIIKENMKDFSVELFEAGVHLKGTEGPIFRI